jgi:PAS domain S-box-containing protein
LVAIESITDTIDFLRKTMETANPMRILFVEDLPSDAELAEREIRKGGLEFISLRVDTKGVFLSALGEFRPDVIISDYSMPMFDGMEALRLSLEHDPTIPFILLTGSMNEETAVECLKAGAANYVIKEHITRLPFAVREALQQKELRVAKNEAEQRLSESEENFRTLYENTAIGLYRATRDGIIILANPMLVKMLGYSSYEELSAKNLEKESFETLYSHRFLIEAMGQQDTVHGLKGSWKKKDGTTMFVNESAHVTRDEQGHILYFDGTVEDITERLQTEKQVVLLAHTMKSIGECVSITDMNDIVLFVNDAFLNTYGYREHEVLGKNINIVRSRNDPPEFAPGILVVTVAEGWNGELTNRTKDGRDFPISLSTSPVRDENGQAIALVGVARDITERKRAEQELLSKIDELQRFLNLSRGRELAMIELKKEINTLLKQAGQPGKYKVVE